MDAPFYVVETDGYPIRIPVSSGGGNYRTEYEVCVCGPDGSIYRREIVNGKSGQFDRRLAEARIASAACAANLNAEALA